jgi:hypothetical protein
MNPEEAEGTFRVRKAVTKDYQLLQTVLDGSLGIAGATVYGMAADELIDHNHVYLAFLAEHPVACVMATQSEPIVWHCLHVEPMVRRLGHAGTLLSVAIGQLDETDEPRAYWTAVDPARQSGVDRCLSLGFCVLSIDFADIQTELGQMCVMVRPAPVDLGQGP